jgi:hypothetical protein
MVLQPKVRISPEFPREKLEREAIAMRRRILGPDHPDTAISVYNLGCYSASQVIWLQA